MSKNWKEKKKSIGPRESLPSPPPPPPPNLKIFVTFYFFSLFDFLILVSIS
jgi:hypothetical protein